MSHEKSPPFPTGITVTKLNLNIRQIINSNNSRSNLPE